MAAQFQFPIVGLPLLPGRRLIAVDAGSHAIKIILAERSGSSVRILRRELIDLQDEGLLSSEEIGPAVTAVLSSMGDYPVVLALPQHLTFSHILDLTSGSQAVKQMIEAETRKNRDLRDSPVVYDFARLHPFGRHQNAFLVTLCKENDILAQIARLALVQEDVIEVVASANVLATGYQSLSPSTGHVALVDIGASGTMVSLCLNGQVVHTANFPIGGNLFTETLATATNTTPEAAEASRQTTNLFAGPDRVEALASVVNSWKMELKRAIDGWLFENPELKLPLSSFRVVLTGGGSQQPGLIEFLNDDPELRFELWRSGSGKHTVPASFAVVYGAAAQALGVGGQSASLLPADLRDHWRKQRVHQRILAGVAGVLMLTMILLGYGTWAKHSAAREKERLVNQAKFALEKAEEIAALRQQLIADYDRIRPVLRKGQRTLDTLKSLALLEQSRTNRNLWYVLFADQPSYFAWKSTNGFPQPFNDSTNLLQRSGFIAELCINQEGEAMRQTLGQVVAELKQSTLFNNVDTLPSDLRRDIAYTNVILPDRHFALSLEMARSHFLPVQSRMRTGETNATPKTPTSRRTEGTR